MENFDLDLDIASYNIHTRELKYLYSNVSTFEEAHLLSLLAMNTKNLSYELIVILPGWNLKMTDDELKKARELAERYKDKWDEKN